MIAALYVHTNGIYYGLPDVDPWDAERDARKYAGPHAVVAHPPCGRWCRLAGLIEKRWGHKKGDDGGCFGSALAAVRKWGGVLEHPAYSDAWARFGLPAPFKHGGWQAGLEGGHSCHVEQGRYGHQARKATWLYVVGCELPELRWGYKPGGYDVLVSACANHTAIEDKRKRIMKAEAARTPVEFRDVMLGIARSVAQGDK